MEANAVETSSTDEIVRRAVRALAVGALVGGMLIVGAIRCPVAMIAHVPCPGCGMTRATMALVHGNVREALHFHPLVFFALPFLSVFFGVNTFMYLKTGIWGWADRRMDRWVTIGAIVFSGLALFVWIARFFGAFGGPVPV